MKMATKKTERKQEPMFTKEQVLASNKYSEHIDVINALWKDDKTKTINQVNKMIEDFMKGKVN